jgi:predicted acetyltransferase
MVKTRRSKSDFAIGIRSNVFYATSARAFDNFQLIKGSRMLLVNPCEKYGQSWKAALMEFEAEKRRGFWSVLKDPSNVTALIRQVYEFSQGINLPEGWVPNTTLWLVDHHEFKGHINIRHQLNPYLEKFGGHIGYAVRPTVRNQGYGDQMLKMALPFARQLGLRKVLITCDESNIGSRKIIESNRGRLENRLKDDRGVVKLCYWITL